jgi:tRNA1Val (adenine37-N6)-methyltransferase
MANSWFRFKQFTIIQERSAFKVGTDAVLLGAWADVSDVRTALDVGTGTGLLALMMAQRSDAEITAIDIDGPSCEEARENVLRSPWKERIKVIHCPLQDFKPNRRFDLIISNPPFFRKSLHPSGMGKQISRHDVSLSLSELIAYARPLLQDTGKLCLILPAAESMNIKKVAHESGLILHRIMGVRPLPSRPAKRSLLEFRPDSTVIPVEYPSGSAGEPMKSRSVLSSGLIEQPEENEPFEEGLIIEMEGRHDYSDDYRELTREFYLDFQVFKPVLQ